ncbi:tetratricopeptide repeat protein, partial [Acidobacteriota bacterium]
WLNDQITDSLSRLVLMCLEKDPERRYQSAEDLLSALINFTEEKVRIADKEEKKASIAVLPFTNMSADPEQEYFCDGISEDIINSLTQINDLRVVARTSAFSFKGKSVDIEEIGRKLKVDKILEGSVRKAGNRLRITAQLINVADGYHLWSEQYNRDLEDVFAIQDEITQAIVEKLKVKLLRKEKESIAKRYKEDAEAYNLYLKGMYFVSMVTARGYEEATKCFQKALQIDPNYALVYCGLAKILMWSTYFENMPPNKGFPRAREYIKKALEIDNTLAEAHTWMGYIHTFYDWNWKEAEREHKLALELNPNSVEVHLWYSQFLTVTEQHEKAMRAAKRAQELDPLSSQNNMVAAQAIFYARQYDRAIEEAKTALKIDDFYGLRYVLGHCYQGKSMFVEATEEFKKAIKLSGRATVLVTWLAITYYKVGKKVEAEKLFESLEKRLRVEYVPSTCFFCIHLARGEEDKALEWLERACKEHDVILSWLRVVPVDLLRIPDESKYQDLLKKYGLEKYS